MAENKRKIKATAKAKKPATKIRASKKQTSSKKPKVPLKKIAKKISAKKKIVRKILVPKKRIKRVPEKTKANLSLERFLGNPIIEPNANLHFESKATFNPSAIIDGDTVRLVYRAIGEGDFSVLGYATSKDGLNFKKESSEAIYAHSSDRNFSETTSKIDYISGGGWSGGCEDPRLTLLDGTVYMTYTAFDGWNSVRIALTSISLDDLRNMRWKWKKPVLISAPDELNKNWVIFPKKINGKFAILHSISPHILIEYVKDLSIFDGKNFIHSIHRDSPAWQLRDKNIRGVGPAPIWTKYGWIILYHGTEEHDSNKYKLFAMILDLKDPTKILYRASKPILEPETPYENMGYKWGIVYSCGAVVKNGKLFVYYGGADTVVAVATVDLESFIKTRISSGVPRLTPFQSK